MKLLRGCEKRIYYMKNTGSTLFEEAYFILKNGCDTSAKKCSLAEEADRIISESSAIFSKRRKRRSLFGRMAMFSLGAATSSAVIGLIALIAASV